MPVRCAAEGCVRSSQVKGYCQAHYERIRKHGDPRAHVPIAPWHHPWNKMTLVERFDKHVIVDADAECWRWQGKLVDGYGVLGVNPGEMGANYPASKRAMAAHVVSWFLTHNRPPLSGMHIDHMCHNMDDFCQGGDRCSHRQCTNPLHLAEVSPMENDKRSRAQRRSREFMTRERPWWAS